MSLREVQATPEFLRTARRVGVIVGIFATLGGLASLAGWYADIPVLADWDGDAVAIQPNTALAAVAAGLALILLALDFRKLAVLPGVLAGLAGATALFQEFSDINLGIDTLLMFAREWGRSSTTAPGRMGPPAGISFTLLGIAFCLAAAPAPARRLAPVLGLIVAGITLLSLIGYIFGVSALFTMPGLTAIALQTSMMLFALGLGLIAAIPEQEPMRMLGENSAAGRLARQSLPFILVLPVALAFTELQGERSSLYEPSMGAAVLVLLLTTLLLMLLWRGVAEVRVGEAALREADRRKDEFLATLAHELRNPLAPVSNALTLLKRSNDPQVLERTREIMERQVSHMVRLIDDLLDISRISSGKLELRPQDVDAVAVMRHAIEACRPICERGSHHVKAHLPAAPVYLRADPIRLAQVFTNLLNNAAKFTPAGGEISLTLVTHAGAAVVTVSDNGIGLPRDQLGHIFELFGQVDTSLERSRGGLGIGLTLARRVTELHGGTIEARSEGPGKGSSFVVRIPGVLERAEPLRQEAQDIVVPANLRVLVVDDNRDNAESLAMLLRHNGTEIHTVHDGAEAVAVAEALRPDAILLDIGLPKMNGYEACRQIRERLDGHKVLIVALTGWGQEQDRRKSIEAGFDGHLVKPVDHAELNRLLASVRGG